MTARSIVMVISLLSLPSRRREIPVTISSCLPAGDPVPVVHI